MDTGFPRSGSRAGTRVGTQELRAGSDVVASQQMPRHCAGSAARSGVFAAKRTPLQMVRLGSRELERSAPLRAFEERAWAPVLARTGNRNATNGTTCSQVNARHVSATCALP